MRAVNDHFVANPIHHGLFFPGGNPGHPLAGGLIAPLLDAGGFRHRFSRDLSASPVPWRSDGDGEPDFDSGNVIDVPAEAWHGKRFDGADGGASIISLTGIASPDRGRNAAFGGPTFPAAADLSDGNGAAFGGPAFPAAADLSDGNGAAFGGPTFPAAADLSDGNDAAFGGPAFPAAAGLSDGNGAASGGPAFPAAAGLSDGNGAASGGPAFPAAADLSDGNGADGQFHRLPPAPGPTAGILALFGPPAADDGSGTPFEVSAIDLPPTAAESHFHGPADGLPVGLIGNGAEEQVITAIGSIFGGIGDALVDFLSVRSGDGGDGGPGIIGPGGEGGTAGEESNLDRRLGITDAILSALGGLAGALAGFLPDGKGNVPNSDLKNPLKVGGWLLSAFAFKASVEAKMKAGKSFEQAHAESLIEAGVGRCQSKLA